MKHHHYEVKIEWTGNEENGTSTYQSYNRNHSIFAKGKYDQILASSDPAFLGDPSRYNPEDLFLSSLSTCHMLWYLHLCTVHRIVVTDYVDHATGMMQETENGSGQFKEVLLRPNVTISNQTLHQKAHDLHSEANKMCFIANSCNFPIQHHATILTK